MLGGGTFSDYSAPKWGFYRVSLFYAKQATKLTLFLKAIVGEGMGAGLGDTGIEAIVEGLTEGLIATVPVLSSGKHAGIAKQSIPSIRCFFFSISKICILKYPDPSTEQTGSMGGIIGFDLILYTGRGMKCAKPEKKADPK